jgi:hypothetical protein
LWDRLAPQVTVEFEQLDQLLGTYRPLLRRCEVTTPDGIELAALAAVPHSLHNGAENLVKRIAVETGEGLPAGEVWHRRLLEQMGEPTDIRPAALAEDLRGRLRPCLDFRDVFRHAPAFDLRRDKMGDLVLHCEEALAALRQSLEGFLSEGRRG